MKIEKFFERFKEARIELGLSQEELAEKIGWARESVIRWETGKNYPRLDALASIAEFLKKPIDFFIGEDIEYNREKNNVIEATYTDNHITEENVPCEKELIFNECVDEIVKTYCSGLLKSNGSTERVSYAIAGLAGYIRVIVNMVPRIKGNTYFLVSGILQALSKSSMEPNRATVENLMPSLIHNISNLKDTDLLDSDDNKEAEDIVELLSQAKENDIQEIEAVLAAVQWLLNNWPHISTETAAYYALNTVCCLLASAPTDYDTRNDIVIRINSFF